MVQDSVVPNVDIVVIGSDKLDTHNALIAATADNELVVFRLAICTWNRLGKANVIEFPHVIHFPVPSE